MDYENQCFCIKNIKNGKNDLNRANFKKNILFLLGKWLVNLIHCSSGIGVVQVDVDVVAEESLFDGEAVAADDLSRRSPILINFVEMV